MRVRRAGNELARVAVQHQLLVSPMTTHEEGIPVLSVDSPDQPICRIAAELSHGTEDIAVHAIQNEPEPDNVNHF
jgi:hypothetical protein